ncbi:MAG: DUF1800 domain-containing protein [Alphaproteobacteria bacterium]|nr:MAG: DUF1800 domain-containing protein [Alphaproteobacteria bacterium]
MATPQAFIAATRFGLGAKRDDFALLSSDPRGWLEVQLDARYLAAPPLADARSTMETIRLWREKKMEMREEKRAAKESPEQIQEKLKGALMELRQDYIAQVAARTRAMANAPAPFIERLVQFWSNHFTVSTTKKQDTALAILFERDAIRPHVLGNFHDMLRASTRHPAMQVYLDNARSIGPDSPAGRFKGKGLNENLAREILELHTLGVQGGYTQKDVTEFAKILTGWTVDADGRGDGSGFFFARLLHQPGSKTLLGDTYREDGVHEGERALSAFASHPSTAKFVATKLARHFIADDPPPGAVDRLAAAFRRYNGDLVAVYRTLISLDEAWQNPLAKVKTPNDLILSILRATGVAAETDDKTIARAYRMLNQLPFSAPSPAGWSDKGKDWIGAEALLQRIDLARFAARGVHPRFNPATLLEDTIGPVASPETRFAVTRAGSAEEGIALLFASPEFQRR